MLSKKSLLETLKAAGTPVSVYSGEAGIKIGVNTDSGVTSKITAIGEDLFEVTATFSDAGRKPTKGYYSIDAVISFGSGLFK